jgi:hypothetical protein
MVASDAQGEGFGGDTRALFGLAHGKLHRLGDRLLIHDAARLAPWPRIAPALGPGESMGEIADAVALQFAEDATGAGTSRIESGCDLDFRDHLISPPV